MEITKYKSPFGNKVSPISIFFASIPYYLCTLFFGKTKEDLDLVAVPKGEVYKNFGVLTLVRRDDSKAMIDKETGKVLKYEEVNRQKAIILGTIRMGFGHWRIAISIASQAHKKGVTTYLLDLLSFSNTPIASSIRFLDNLYSRLSRFSQKSKWFNEHIWEKITSKTSLTLDSMIQQHKVSSLFTPAFNKLPKELPLVSAHPWVGQGAIQAGFHKVISMIPDNLPLAFWLVEGSIHTVQAPSSYMGYRALLHMEKGYEITHCIPPENVVEAGHYVDYEIEKNINHDCNLRIKRAKNKEGRRFLLTMGGAGAQALKFRDIAVFLHSYIKENKACLLINMGDHEGRWKILKKHLDKRAIEYTMHTDWKETKAFIRDNEKTINGIHIFLHKDFYAAVYATNLLLRISDIMITKPSELSFYPIPKLFIQRVGRHEAWGAIRSSEIGDGTKETTSKSILHRVLKTLIEEDDLFFMYINHILLNHRSGIYSGASKVVELSLSSNSLA